jgi:hypothetical protein
VKGYDATKQEEADYWTRGHPEHVVLDIGGTFGALVLYTPPELRGREIEITPVGQDGGRVHTAVLERIVAGRTIFAAVFPRLAAGMFRLCYDKDPTRPDTVEIQAGEVTELDWR